MIGTTLLYQVPISRFSFFWNPWLIKNFEFYLFLSAFFVLMGDPPCKSLISGNLILISPIFIADYPFKFLSPK